MNYWQKAIWVNHLRGTPPEPVIQEFNLSVTVAEAYRFIIERTREDARNHASELGARIAELEAELERLRQKARKVIATNFGISPSSLCEYNGPEVALVAGRAVAEAFGLDGEP